MCPKHVPLISPALRLYVIISRLVTSALSLADNRGDREWVTEAVSILERHGTAIDERPAGVNKAVVVPEALEDPGVDEAS